MRNTNRIKCIFDTISPFLLKNQCIFVSGGVLMNYCQRENSIRASFERLRRFWDTCVKQEACKTCLCNLSMYVYVYTQMNI